MSTDPAPPVPVTPEEHLSLEAPWIGRCRLLGLRIGAGPVAATVVAGIHGDEITGVHAANLLIARLRRGDLALHGAVRVLPLSNPAGAEEGSRRWPVEDANLQELFPGDPEGWAGERLARAILDASAGAIGVELQTGSALLRERPHLRTDPAGPLPCRLPLLTDADPGNLAACWQERGLRAFALRGGRAGTLDPDVAADLAAAALDLLRAAGVISPGDPAAPAPPAPPPIRSTLEIRSRRGGLFLPALACGDPVRQGDLLGLITDPVGGDPAEEIRAPAPGAVLALRAWPLVYGSELLVRLALL